ncbi:hypothetical protein [Paenibacillus lautus]|uniref:hypothetical protein n=1 Tax=Paenibacillus lautus TaxID=1401 RepID=UPI001C7DC058|nr:hypothetical protein [Paenibacillus lautus]MBX4152414.1 hypothetical protein [Paenibacillus lautus]
MDQQQVMEKVFEYIDGIASKLGVASEMVLGILTKQQYIKGVLGIVMTVFLWVLAYIIFNKVSPRVVNWMKNDIERKNQKSVYKNHDMMDYPHIIIPGAVILLALTIATCLHTFEVLPESVNMLLNPEYFVMRDLLEVFK